MEIPMPGETVDGSIVIASVWGNDGSEGSIPEWVLLLLLNRESPYYRVVQLDKYGQIFHLETHINIISAVLGGMTPCDPETGELATEHENYSKTYGYKGLGGDW